jgi:hypothetical protein
MLVKFCDTYVCVAYAQMFDPLLGQQFENICEILDNTVATRVGQRYNMCNSLYLLYYIEHVCYRSHLGQPFIVRHKLTPMGLSDDVDRTKIGGIWYNEWDMFTHQVVDYVV